MSTHRIPLSIPDLAEAEASRLAACIADNWISTAGPAVTELERRFAELSGRRHAAAVATGTAALQLALMALGVRGGDAVLVPDFTFAATANAAIRVGAVPVFVDIDPVGLTLDPRALALAFARGVPGRRIAAVLAVDVIGQIADFPAIAELCRRHGAALVEDAAGSIGARLNGWPAGGFGDAATFSLNGNKVVTGGGGGLVVTDDGDLAARIRHYSSQARIGRRYRYAAAGDNLRLTNLNAAVALGQLDRLDAMLAARRRIASRYDAAVAARADGALAVPVRRLGNESNNWLYSVVCRSARAADALVEFLDGQGIEARHFWERLSDQAPYREFPAFDCPVASNVSGRLVSLPSSSNLPVADQARVIAALGAWREPAA